MASTYCGKSCDNCGYREELKCNGCQNGPGNVFYGDCDIAECCRQHCLEQCADCESKMGCETYNSAGKKAYFRSIKTESKNNQSQDSGKVEVCRFMEKRVRMIVILSILQIILNLFTNTKLIDVPATLYYTALFAGLVVGIIYGAILISMSRESNRFKFAGGCYIVAPIVTLLSVFTYNLNIITFIGVLMIIVSFIAMYQEIYGFSDALRGIDNALSLKWCGIWKKLITWMVVMFVSAFVMFIIPIIGIIGLVVSVIGLLVASIMRLVCIVDTANAYDNYVRIHE